MRILVAPVLVGDRICRIISPIASLLEVEEWVGEWWEPSTVTLTTASQSPSAPDRLLEERGVPAADRVATEPRTSDPEIQGLMRADQPARAPSARIEDTFTPRAHGARRRQYSGNGRFRRPRESTPLSTLDRADLRRPGSEGDWQGPFRRATDQTSIAPSARASTERADRASADRADRPTNEPADPRTS